MFADAAVVDAALDQLARSKSCVQENERLLAETRHRVAASRRGLNRAFAVAGAVSDDDRLRTIVRARLASGALLPVNGHSWAGHGSGRPCAVCDAPIGSAEIEYEVKGPKGEALVHLNCFTAWHRESERSRREPPRASGALLARLQESHGDHIVLNDQSQIFLTPKVRCAYPAGTRLQIVYTESDGKKIALSIERYQLS